MIQERVKLCRSCQPIGLCQAGQNREARKSNLQTRIANLENALNLDPPPPRKIARVMRASKRALKSQLGNVNKQWKQERISYGCRQTVALESG